MGWPCVVAPVFWIFNKNENACVLFDYGGCNGSLPTFSTEEECIKTCINFHKNPKI